MINKSTIFIQNIFYMLSYAFRVLKEDYYKNFGAEPFEHINDLMLAILTKGMNRQIKRGIFKNYRVLKEESPNFKGKLLIQDSIKLRIRNKKKLSMEMDELSPNNYLNQLIKSTITLLTQQKDIRSELKKEAQKTLFNLTEVDSLDLKRIKRSHIQINKHHQDYHMLISICMMVIDRLLMAGNSSSQKLKDFTDDQTLPRLFEKFVFEYYRYHYPNINVSAAQVPWDVTEGSLSLLPAMKTDITLKHKGHTLIIDTKFYQKSLSQSQYNEERYTLHSNNLYQIFSYVQNLDNDNEGKVSGLILYAKTSELVSPHAKFKIKGNIIASRSLDLNTEFVNIRSQLNQIAEEFLPQI